MIDRMDNPQAQTSTPPQPAPNERQQQQQSHSRTETASASSTAAATQSATNTPTRGHLGRGSLQSASAGSSVPDVRVMASSAAGAFPPDLAQAISGIVQNVIDGSVAHGQPGQQFEMQVQVQVGLNDC